MKARPNLPKQMREQAEELMYDYTLQAVETNNAFFLIALNQEYNFGTERITRLIHRYNDVSLMYRDYVRDGFSDEEIRGVLKNALKDIGIDPEQVFSGKGKGYFEKVKKEQRTFEKNNIPTYSEASDAVEHLKAFKAALKEQKIV